MPIYPLLHNLYENGEIKIADSGAVSLSDIAFGQASMASGTHCEECRAALATLCAHLMGSQDMARLLKHHAEAMAKKAEKPNYSADLKNALRLH